MTCKAIWLDPASPLQSHEQAQLAQAGWQVQTIRTLDELPTWAPQADVLVLRLHFDTTALQGALAHLEQLALPCPVVCRVDASLLDLAVAAARMGVEHVLAADDWHTATWRQLAQKLKHKPEQQTPPRPAGQPLRDVVFVDPVSQHLLALAQRVAQAEVTALLVGPTGSGKEVLARVLHQSSPRAAGPFVAFNCAAMPEHLIEDLLFGHEKGAFTGAHRDHKGLFEQAQGGTIFLDEIGDMPLALQAKLLRVLQERQLTRLGGQQALDLNVRVIAATHKDLRQAIVQREFREDLYYRIATFRLQVPALAERPGDIVPLAMSCLARHGPGMGWQLTPDAQAALQAYPWPGNVRELENVMRRALVLAQGPVVGLAQLMFDETAASAWTPPTRPQAGPTPGWTSPPADPVAHLPYGTPPLPACGGSPVQPSAQDLSSAVRENERQIIMAALAATRSRMEAAQRLGISPRTLRYKLAQLRDSGLSMALD